MNGGGWGSVNHVNQLASSLLRQGPDLSRLLGTVFFRTCPLLLEVHTNVL